jgi:hypothetical protein
MIGVDGMEYRPRQGDFRPFKRDPSEKIQWVFNTRFPFRWLPRHGEPSCIIEWLSQQMIKTLAYLPVYTAVIVTLVLLVEIFGIPFVGGK